MADFFFKHIWSGRSNSSLVDFHVRFELVVAFFGVALCGWAFCGIAFRGVAFGSVALYGDGEA